MTIVNVKIEGFTIVTNIFGRLKIKVLEVSIDEKTNIVTKKWVTGKKEHLQMLSNSLLL